MSDFQIDILNSVIDYLLIGILIAFAGFVFNIVLTRYKEEQNFKFQLNTIRTQKIAESWEKLYQTTFKVEQKIIELNDILHGDIKLLNFFTPISPQKYEIDSLSNDLKIVLISNKFWFEQSDFNVLWDYASYLNSINNVNDSSSLKIFKDKLELRENNIIKIRDDILNE